MQPVCVNRCSTQYSVHRGVTTSLGLNCWLRDVYSVFPQKLGMKGLSSCFPAIQSLSHEFHCHEEPECKAEYSDSRREKETFKAECGSGRVYKSRT